MLEQILLNSIMKKFTLMLLLVSLLSCTNEERTDSTSELDDPIQQFTQVISKVIYNEGSVRQFIKTKALEKFDNDYEILYSCIKEEMIGESNTYATNFKYDLSQTTSGDFKIGDKIGFGIKTVGSIGGSKDKQHQIKSQYTYSTTRGSDDLGSITWRYVDPIILEESTENGVAGYNVLSKSSGSISITVLPVKR